MGFWELIQGWLKNEGKQVVPCSKQLPISHELIHRSDEEIADYLKWKTSPCKKELLSYISKNYTVWKNTSCEQCHAIDFLKGKSFRGFVVHFMDLSRNCDEVRHLFDYLKERLLVLGYKSYVSDAKEFQRTRWIERVEKHYLKPPLKIEPDKKQHQLFGNINIELLFRDGEPLHLKFGVCAYNDSQFEEADQFEKLVQFISED